MNTSRDTGGVNETPAEKAVEDLVRASADAMEMAMKGEWAKDIDAAAPPIHPLLAHPTALMAAATVVGMGVSSQLAGMWLGFMKGFVETASHEAEGQEPEQPPKTSTEKTDALRVVADNNNNTQVRKKTAVQRASSKAHSKSVAGGDDLKRISGIGPKLASVLAERGFATYAAIAAMNVEAAEALDRDLGLDGRIDRDDWIGQAKALMEDDS
ncbi:helix-hairpin-helix domain-containing protein [Rhizobium sp. L1K21]|uniref:helix-hairpin-helix domain-containing protein n=1 Tax=Rhizobium sp. L1K21 TaxID=2954933 RepID=UPI002091F7A8|nr:helix-hairpin-helix domain-containing protein [Rhizobium sp. L1K21]MCO6186101.1 helix-hairpin-helix domain-containing protein [Rhizobium sp. L1K21]